MSQYKLIAGLLLALSLSACGGDRTLPDPEPTDEVYNEGANTDGMDSAGMGAGEAVPYDGEELSNVIYFDYDQYDIRPEYNDVVRRHAMQLGNNPGARVRLEGNTDVRGSREYNIGLGEKRAQAVRRMLLIQGVPAAQIQTVSFGEERLASNGESDRDHALNRRVEIKYIN